MDSSNTQKCSKCLEIFESKSLYKLHLLKEHGLRKNWSCSTCGKTFSRKEHLERHNRISHEGETESCPVCSTDLSDKYKLRFHLVHRHGFLRCASCTNVFDKKAGHNCEKEIKSKEPEIAFICNICETELATAEELDQHMNAEHPTRPNQQAALRRTREPQVTSHEVDSEEKRLLKRKEEERREFMRRGGCCQCGSINCGMGPHPYLDKRMHFTEGFPDFCPPPPYWFANPSSNPYGCCPFHSMSPMMNPMDFPICDPSFYYPPFSQMPHQTHFPPNSPHLPQNQCCGDFDIAQQNFDTFGMPLPPPQSFEGFPAGFCGF